MAANKKGHGSKPHSGYRTSGTGAQGFSGARQASMKRKKVARRPPIRGIYPTSHPRGVHR